MTDNEKKKAAKVFADYSDDQLRDLFTGNIVLASDTAARLIDRGFLDCIGVEVHPWNGKALTGEIMGFDHYICKRRKMPWNYDRSMRGVVQIRMFITVLTGTLPKNGFFQDVRFSKMLMEVQPSYFAVLLFQRFIIQKVFLS